LSLFLLDTLHVSGALCIHHQEYFKKLYMQLGNVVVVSVPVGCRMVGEWERPALAVAKSLNLYFKKLYMQLGNVVVVSVPVGCRMVGEWERPALAVAKSRIF
jgi:putative transposon-encoded protein